MIIKKLALPRRTFLRGIGATVALPLLDAMSPALTATVKTAAKPVGRLGFIYIPNGVNLSKWTPVEEGTKFEITPTLTPLAPYRNQMVVLTGLAHRQAESQGDGSGDHSRGCASWLTGTHGKRTEAGDVRAGTSADQIAASVLGRDTLLPSLELATEQNDKMVGNCESGYSCVYQNTFCWRTPTTPVPMEVHPRVVFERLFGDGTNPAQRLDQLRTTRSILDTITEEIARLRGTLGVSDQSRMDQYLDSVREVEQRVHKAELYNEDSPIAPPERPVDIPEKFEDHAKLMFDLQALAYQGDVTRVISFQLGRELSARTFPEIGVPEPHHTISHHRDDPALLEKYAKINTYHLELVAYYLEKLRSLPDGDGTLLDHVSILYGGGLGDGNLHAHYNLPVLLLGGAGGRIKGGRHLKYPEYTPMSNLLVNLLDKVDVPIDKLGDSTGSLQYLTGV